MVRGGHLWREQDSAAAVWCGAALPRGALGALSGARARCAAGHTVAHTPALPWATAMVVRATGALRAVRVSGLHGPRGDRLWQDALTAPRCRCCLRPPQDPRMSFLLVHDIAEHGGALADLGQVCIDLHTHNHTHTHTHACHMQRLSAYACTGVCLFM